MDSFKIHDIFGIFDFCGFNNFELLNLQLTI